MEKKEVIIVFLMLLSNWGFAQNWQSLFNGKTLDGWAVVDKPANVQIKDSSMVLHMTPYTSRHAFVRTLEKYRDFIFEVEFRRDLILDGGVLFRSVDAPDTAFSALFGYMVKIDPQPTRLWTGGIFDDFGNTWRWMSTLEGNPTAQNALKNAGEWDTWRIEAVGNHLKIWLNGIPVSNVVNDKHREGYIALKIHFMGNNPDNEQFSANIKNIRIQTKKVKKYAQKMDLPEQKVD